MKHIQIKLLAALGAALSIGIAGCESTGSGPDQDPYAGLSCSAKLEKMTGELRAFEAAKPAAAKRGSLAGAQDTPVADTATRVTDTSTRTIQQFRGYPPVAGMDPTDPRVQIGERDSRDSTTTFPRDTSATGPQLVWIPPVGFSDTARVPPVIALDSSVRDSSGLVALPEHISAVQMVSTSAYRAHITIHDYADRIIRTLDQEFGYNGELFNPSRAVPNGVVSYLIWDMKDAAGNRVPDGVYLWKARLTYASGAVEEWTQKTGLLGEACQAELAQ